MRCFGRRLVLVAIIGITVCGTVVQSRSYADKRQLDDNADNAVNDNSFRKSDRISSDDNNGVDFSPSHEVFFRRSDEGELLLPALAPYTGYSGALEKSSTNQRPSYKPTYNALPAYGPPKEPDQVCLLRTCDQTITGRDLTYERALEIVQNEEYLLEVDADLIRRRVDYGGFSNDFDNTADEDNWSQRLPYRKKRSAEPSPVFEDADAKARFFNVTGFGTVTYDWRGVINEYFKLGIATALLIGLSTRVQAPSEPIIPFNLPTFPSAKEDKLELKKQEILYATKKQPYQEQNDFVSTNFDTKSDDYSVPSKAPKSVTENKVEVVEKENAEVKEADGDDSLKKRIDILPGFLRPKRHRRRRRRKHPKKRPGIPPKREVLPEPIQAVPAKVTPTNKENLAVPSQAFNNFGGSDLDFKLLDENKFKSYFPSWSRKRREANAILEDEYIVPESRLFNITKTGFGTITYDWRDVINDYLRYLLAAGLLVGVASSLSAPGSPLLPVDLPARAAPDLPPNLPEGLVPPGNPQPGTPGGGAKPIGNTPQAQEALDLAPPGTVPVSIFPPYASPRTVPAVSVIFLENSLPSLVRKKRDIWQMIGNGFTNIGRSYKCLRATLLRKKRSPDEPGYVAPSYGAPTYNAPECSPYNNLKYGFRTRVTLVENQSCILGVTCTATGERINVAGGQQFAFNSVNRRSGKIGGARRLRRRQGVSRNGASAIFGIGNRRQTGEEFSSDAPPYCRAVRDPTNGCLAYRNF